VIKHTWTVDNSMQYFISDPTINNTIVVKTQFTTSHAEKSGQRLKKAINMAPS